LASISLIAFSHNPQFLWLIEKVEFDNAENKKDNDEK